LSDVLGLLLSWGAHYFSRTPPTTRRTYGLRRTSILAALGNALILLVAIGAIAWEAIHRFRQPQNPAGMTIVWVAGIGVLVNAATAWLLMAGRKSDLNVRSAFLHMAADAGVSLGVVAAGLIMRFADAPRIDPAVSLLVALVILVGTWGLLRDSVALAVDSVPEGIDPAEVRAYLAGLAGVAEVHDLHIWPLSTTETALTVHLVKPDAAGDERLLAETSRVLKERFGIGHSTVQLERRPAPARAGSARARRSSSRRC
jgi:cobalt-zinc-cadmium efflux system protein